MKAISSVCVYCGSSNGSDPVFIESATELGRDLALNGVSLVYGGGSLGLMGAVARSALAHGGHVVGIIPEFLKNHEKMLEDTQEHIVVPDMHVRKQMMYDRADAFLALPGGVGTLEEVVEQITWAQLRRHAKPIILVNIKNYWAPLLDLFQHMRAKGFIRPQMEIAYQVVERVEDVVPLLQGIGAPMEPQPVL